MNEILVIEVTLEISFKAQQKKIITSLAYRAIYLYVYQDIMNLQCNVCSGWLKTVAKINR